MLVAGVDIGSCTTKCVLLDEGGTVRSRGEVDTTADLADAARQALRVALEAAGFFGDAIACTATTGLGRSAVPFRDIQMTDLNCGALGAARLCPDARCVLDIGVRSARALRLRDGGKVEASRWVMRVETEIDALADRARLLLEQVGLAGPVAFIGGLARHEGMVTALRDRVCVPVYVPDGPQFTAATGAALLGLARLRRPSLLRH
jgi:activator of 2-hydroxyglutaryl-CoA dehydratase